MSDDPIGLAGGINPYVFAGDDPINGRDPTGLDEYCGEGMELWVSFRRLYRNGREIGKLAVGFECVGAGSEGGGPSGLPTADVLQTVCTALGSPLFIDAPISSPFGAEREWPLSNPHVGIDRGVQLFTPVRAMATGRVYQAGFEATAGNRIGINHFFSGYTGLKTRYLHLSVLFVGEGDIVLKGQVIALSSNTGVVTGPNVHVEAFYEWDDKINPQGCL